MISHYQVYRHQSSASTAYLSSVTAAQLVDEHSVSPTRSVPDVSWAVEHFIRQGQLVATEEEQTVVVVEWDEGSKTVGDVWLFTLRQGEPVALIDGLDGKPIQVVR